MSAILSRPHFFIAASLSAKIRYNNWTEEIHLASPERFCCHKGDQNLGHRNSVPVHTKCILHSMPFVRDHIANCLISTSCSLLDCVCANVLVPVYVRSSPDTAFTLPMIISYILLFTLLPTNMLYQFYMICCTTHRVVIVIYIFRNLFDCNF